MSLLMIIVEKFSTFPAKSLEMKLISEQRKLARRRRLVQAKIAWDYHRKVPNPRELSDYSNYQKQKRLVTRIYARIRQQHHDYLHRLTTWLVKDFDIIILEGLQIKNLLKNHRLAKYIATASWSQFKQLVIYKADWYGKTVVTINPQYASQLCADCDYASGPKPFAIR